MLCYDITGVCMTDTGKREKTDGRFTSENNPKGRARGYAQLARRLEDMTPRALTQLAKLAFDGESETIRLAACKDILDRSLGRAKQNVAVAVTHSLADMHLAALRVLSERARIAQAVTIDGEAVATAALAHD